MNRTATVSTFDHLQHLTDGRGLFEHARFGEPRPEHGYCLDDVARGLIVTCREPHPTGAVRRLAAGYLDFTLEIQGVIEGVVRGYRRAVLENQPKFYKPWVPKEGKWLS